MRFLLVDDDVNDRDLMVYAIGESHSLEVAGSISEAFDKIERAEQTHGQFDAVLLDLGLPDSDGENTFERMQQRVRPTPIVIYSGHEDIRIARKLMAKGASNYAVKSPQTRSEVVIFHLEQAAISARSQSAAEIELRTAARAAREEADAVEASIKSLPPSRSPNPNSARLEELVMHVLSMQTVQTRLLATAHESNVQQDKELAEQRTATATARQQAMSAEQAAKIATTDVQRLRDLTPRNKSILAGSVVAIVTFLAAVFEGLRKAGVLDRIFGP